MIKTSNSSFPSNKKLAEATIKALEDFGKAMSVPQINVKVIEILDLPDEIVQLEDENGLGTKLEYRLRWIRTDLKTKGKIVNLKKGFWQLKEN